MEAHIPLFVARFFHRDDLPTPDFDAVLREQLSGPDHRLAQLNGELARIGSADPAALPLLLEAGRCYLYKNDHLRQQYYAAPRAERGPQPRGNGGVRRAYGWK